MALTAIFQSIGLTISQIGDTRFSRVLGWGLTLTVALLIGAAAILGGLVNWLVGDTIWLPFVGDVQWFDDALGWGAVILVMILSIFLMIPIASAITSLFLDDVADAVEALHYPHLPQKPRTPFWDGLGDTMSFLGVIVGVNILALILYVIFAPIAIFIFWAVNGLLLGREYFMLVAMRRVGRRGAKELRRRHFATIWAAGTLMAIPLTVPILNLVVPILGAATFTHLYQFLTTERRDPPSFPDRPR